MLKLLDTLAAEPSKNAKLELLKGISETGDSALFEKVVAAAYNPFINYYITDWPTPPGYLGVMDLEDAVDAVQDMLATRTLTGNAARDWLSLTMSQLTEDDATVLARIIKRDLRSGFTANSAAKVWKKLQFKHPYQRGSSFDAKYLKKLQFPCYSQLKSDGLYSDTVAREESVICLSRSGKVQAFTNPARDKALIAEAKANGEVVVMGEVLVRDENGNIMDRAASNGYMNRDPEDRDDSRIFISAWDMVPVEDWGPKMKCKIPYSERFARLEKFCKANPNIGIELTEHRVCNNVQEIIEHFTEVRERGEEGLMLKNPAMGWKDGTSTEMVKLKVVMEVEVAIIGWNYGKKGSKYEEMIGSIQAESECGLVQVNVSGMSDDLRAAVAEMDKMVKNRQIMTVKCNGVTDSKSKPGTYSLFLPRLKEFRVDKTVADDLAKMQLQEASFTDALALIK